jgi:hypothetical protein
MKSWSKVMKKIKMVLPKQNSPITAIRKYCTECSGGSRKDIAECNLYHCPLFPYRFGMMPDTYIKSNENEVEIINEKGQVTKDEKGHKSRKRV